MLKKVLASLLSVLFLVGPSINAFAASPTKPSQKIENQYAINPPSKEEQINDIKSYLNKYHLKI